MTRPQLATLWIGDRLGPLEVLSARSFLAAGNDLTIYTYGPLADVPDGVRRADANDILSGAKIARYKGNGSPSLHSNLFRFALLAKTDATWVDLDIFALKPFDFGSDFVFGWEDDTHVNTAVLRLPKTSATLGHLSAFRPDSFGYPPVMGRLQRLKFYAMSLGRGLPIERWGWGATGPIALTYFLKATGEVRHALPREVFYPVHWRALPPLVTPGALSIEGLPNICRGVHFYQSQLQRIIDRSHGGRIPAGSFLDEAMARVGLDKRDFV